MRFVARQPREGINVSDTHPLGEAGTLVIGLTAIFVFIALALVFIVEIALYFVPADEEAAMFESWLPDDLITVAPDDERLAQTQHLVDRLAEHWPDSPYEFRVEIDESEMANAMALPGGLIIVTQGLLDQVESENELAFVLGHELGHFKNRDHMRALGRGVVVSIVFAMLTSGDVAGIGIKAADLTVRSFSRRQESAADEFGLFVVNSEYGHVDEAWRLFERWNIDDDTGFDFVAYLATHPETTARIEAMKAHAVSADWRLEGDISPLDW